MSLVQCCKRRKVTNFIVRSREKKTKIAVFLRIWKISGVIPIPKETQLRIRDVVLKWLTDYLTRTSPITKLISLVKQLVLK